MLKFVKQDLEHFDKVVGASFFFFFFLRAATLRFSDNAAASLIRQLSGRDAWSHCGGCIHVSSRNGSAAVPFSSRREQPVAHSCTSPWDRTKDSK